jgi:serine/threonine-protein kinase
MPADDTLDLPEGLNLLDRYTIIDRIGGGGMATIYRAHDSRLDRIVCVKVLRSLIEGLGSSSSGGIVYQATYTHFLQEARALCKLAHPNTLRIYDFGYLDVGGDGSGAVGPRPFHVSEFLDGGNLEQYVRARGALGPSEVLAILDRVASAVDEAHRAGILHRDIKPSNILFSRVGDVLMPKLADFGIAQSVEVRASSPMPAAAPIADAEHDPPARPPRADSEPDAYEHVPLFSPRWAAPEQLTISEEGPYTDVYALALVAAFMMSGRPLFQLEDVDATFEDRVTGDAFVTERLAVCRVAAGMPEVIRVLLRALRADPRTRIPSPLAFYEALSKAFAASLPETGAAPIAFSGGVPRLQAPGANARGAREQSPGVPLSLPNPRAAHESVTLQAGPDRGADARPAAARATLAPPPERWTAVSCRQGTRRVRIVETHERIDLGVPTSAGVEVRFRVTLLPGQRDEFRVNVKGLNCFVAKPGGSVSPAIVASEDGTARFLSTHKEELGAVSWQFGSLRYDDARPLATANAKTANANVGGNAENGARVFVVDGGTLVVPFPEGVFALALELGADRELIVVSRRA